MLCVVSESPYWLVLKNRIEDAKKSLKNLHPNKSEAEIERLAHEMQYTVAKERENKEMNNASYIECFQGANLRRTFCALFPSCSQQLVGNQLVQSYSTCKSLLLCWSPTTLDLGTDQNLPHRLLHSCQTQQCTSRQCHCFHRWSRCLRRRLLPD